MYIYSRFNLPLRLKAPESPRLRHNGGMIILDIQIILKRENFLVCVKPAGIISESAGLPALLSKQENIPVLFPVHRLDKGTGGLMILAVNPSVCALLSEFFAAQQVQKTYLAVVCAEQMPGSGFFEDLLFHDKSRNKSYVVRSLRKGVKKASCTWTLLNSVKTDGTSFHLVRVLLHTGRTHQIRVQFSSRGMPLVGDIRYGSKIRTDFPALWASGLSFPDPENPCKQLSFQAPPPPEWPWSLFSPYAPANAADENAHLLQAGEFPFL